MDGALAVSKAPHNNFQYVGLSSLAKAFVKLYSIGVHFTSSRVSQKPPPAYAILYTRSRS